MKAFIVLAALIAVVASQAAPPAVPIPYSFNYNSQTEDGGQSSHQENGDGNGRVSGSYTVNNLEGHSRVVEYIADENGFRVFVKTNEPGTANQNPADVNIESSAVDAANFPVFNNAVGQAAPKPAATTPERKPDVRYVMVPSGDPRAAGYN